MKILEVIGGIILRMLLYMVLLVLMMIPVLLSYRIVMFIIGG